MRVTFANLGEIATQTWEKARSLLVDDLDTAQATINNTWGIENNPDGTRKTSPWVDEATNATEVAAHLQTGWAPDNLSAGNIRYKILEKTTCVLQFNLYQFVWTGAPTTFFTMHVPGAVTVHLPGFALYYTGQIAVSDSGKTPANTGGYCQVGALTPGILTMFRNDLDTFIGPFIGIQGQITFEVDPA